MSGEAALPRGDAAPDGRHGAAPVLLVLGAIGSSQVSAAVATHMFDDVGPAGATLLRTFLAAVLLLAVARPAVGAVSRRTWRVLVPYGLALGLMNLCFYLGVDRVDLGVAVAIEFLGPLTVGAVLARRATDRLWVVLAAAGVLALTEPWSSSGADLVGVAWLLGAAACWGAYIPLGARASGALPGLQPVALAMVMAPLVALVPGVVQGGGALLRGDVLLVGLVAATAGSAIPYALEQVALRDIAPGAFGVLMAIEPGVAMLAGLAVLHQEPHLLGLAGLVLVIAAGVGATRASSRAARAVAAGPQP